MGEFFPTSSQFLGRWQHQHSAVNSAIPLALAENTLNCKLLRKQEPKILEQGKTHLNNRYSKMHCNEWTRQNNWSWEKVKVEKKSKYLCTATGLFSQSNGAVLIFSDPLQNYFTASYFRSQQNGDSYVHFQQEEHWFQIWKVIWSARWFEDEHGNPQRGVQLCSMQ